MKSCDECQLFINVGKMIKLKNSSEQVKTLCKNCYKKMTKEHKKQYTFVEGSKIDVVGGFMFGIFGIQGTISGKNPSVKKSQEQYHYTQKEMDDFSIDIFNMHTELLSEDKHLAVMDRFEGRTDSMYYKKYIQNNVKP